MADPSRDRDLPIRRIAAAPRGSAVVCAALLLASCALFSTRPAAAEPVALTFDDLPVMSIVEDADYERITMTRLIAGLRRHKAPAIGFVIGGDVVDSPRGGGYAMMDQWLRAGFPIGNHTWSHPSLNKIGAEAYIADTAKNDRLLRKLLHKSGRTPHWFRHPYLETGATLADKDRFEVWLKAHGYRVAPVTMENSDWMFSPVYDDALRRGDTAKANAVRSAYLDYTRNVVGWYRKAGLDLLGRRPAFVFLLHACRLNADVIDDLDAILTSQNLQPVTLEAAMRDPAYKLSDAWADPDGDEWLTRWAHVLKKNLPWDDFPNPPADIAAESERLDPSD